MDTSNALRKEMIERYELRLNTLRKKNDASHGEIETAKLRGKIYEVKDILLYLNSNKGDGTIALSS